MSTFWSSDDKIPVKQTKISIPAEHGLDYDAGQVVNITIPANVRFIQPKETYLKFDVLLKGGTAGNRVMLDAECGGQVLIRDIRIYSGGAGGSLLEEIQNYNVLTALKYDYENNETIRNKRGLTEGCNDFNSEQRGTYLSMKSNLNNVSKNAYSRAYTKDELEHDGYFGTATSSPVGTADSTTGLFQGLQKVKCLLPLNTGIFSNDKVFPSLLTEGLRLEILLEQAPRCIRILDTLNRYNRIGTAPIVHSVGALAVGTPAETGGCDPSSAANAWDTTDGNGQAIRYIWFRRDNQMTNVSNFPLAVGEYFDLLDMNKSPLDGVAATNVRPAYSGGSTAYAGATSGDDGLLRVEAIQFFPGDTANPTTTLGGAYGLIRVKLEANAYLWRQAGAPVGYAVSGTHGNWVAFSKEIATRTGFTYNPSYTISDVELIVQEVEMPQGYVSKMMSMMKEGGVLNYDFLSYTNYKYSQLAGDVVANIRLPLNQSKAKSILSIPTDSSVYSNIKQVTGSDLSWGAGVGATALTQVVTYPAFDSANYTYNNRNTLPFLAADPPTGNGTGITCCDHWMNSVRSGMVGIWDELQQYQWFYNGKLNPSRQVDCSEVATGRSLSQQWCIEAEKALAMAGIRPLSFKAQHTNAFLGRALALQTGVYDTRGRDFNLQVEYTGVAPIKNKLWHNFVAHIRSLQIKGNQISLQI